MTDLTCNAKHSTPNAQGKMEGEWGSLCYYLLSEKMRAN